LASAKLAGTPMNACDAIDSNCRLLIAHRGGSRNAPENTLPAFSSAMALGVDFVEFDYLHSADNVPVVFHDRTLDRTTNAVALWGGRNIALKSKTAEELRELDAASWFEDRFAGVGIPTLEEALALICSRSLAMVERKEGDAATCIRLLNRTGWLDRVVVQAFDWSFLRECHRLAPRLALGALGENELTPEKLKPAEELGAKIVGWNNKTLTEAEVNLARQHGLQIWVWTVNDVDRARELLEWGVQGLISDTPDQLIDLVRNKR
jgi:glycerophosphoryl diester phosphodiesterase